MFTVKTFKPLPKQLKQDICRTFALPFLETSEIEYIPADLGPPFAIRRIKGDGNCLFRALAFMICGDEDQHFKVRTIIVDYIETSQAVEQSGVLGSDPLTYLRMTKMSEDRTWGTDVELMVASAAFQIPIYTYTQYGGQYKWLEFLPREITRDCSRTFTCALYIQHTSLCHYDVVTSVKCNHDVENYGQATQLDNCKVLTLSDTDQEVSEEEDVLGMSVDMIHETNISTTSKQFIESIAASSDELGVSLEESVDELGVSLANLDISEMREEMNDSKQNSSGDFNMSTQIKEDSFNDSAESFSLLVENDDILMMGNRQTVDPYDFVSEIEDTLFTPSAMQLTSTPRKMKKSTQEAKDQIITDDEETEDNLSINDISFQESATAFKQNFTPRVKTSKLLQKALDNSRLSIKKLKCCNCLPTITEDSIKNCRYRFWSKSIEQRVEWFLDKASEVKIKQGRTFFNIHGGKRVCSFCFRNLYKISKNFFYKYLKKGRKGDFAAGVLRRRGMGKTTNQAISWIEDYSSNRADQMPNNSDLMLPCGTRKISIYEQYVAEKTENLNYSVSRSAFYKLWVDRFSHLKIKQVNSFSKCTVCVYIERDLQKTRDPVQRAYLKKLMTVHNDRQMTERRYYYEKREQAKLNPSKYMSIIVDGMDQAKTNLPHFTGRLHKGIDPSSLLKTHIQGVINHGMHTFDTYVDICEYSHDANLVMNIILRSINAAIAKDGKLPEVLFIQADNCARENKNKYILGFCELLIMLSVFKEVHLSFLYVGHTHEDIDAAFSKIAETLRSKDVETIPKLLMTFGAVQLQGLFDIKSWLMGYLKDVKHHSKPLHFKFTRDSTNTTCSWYRANSTKPCVRLEETILHGVPAGKPLILVPPNFGKIMVEGIKSNIEKSRYIMSGETQYKWWCGFIAELKELQQSEKKVKQYARKGALWLLPQLQNKAFLHQHKVKEISIASHIETLMDKDLDEKVVTVHCKKSRKKTTATRKPVAKQ